MTKYLSEAQRNNELRCLIKEQADDMASTCLFPEQIRPLSPTVLEGLTAKEKASIILSVIAKMSNVEIGEALSVNESSIRGHIKRGRRKVLQKYSR